MPANMAPRLSPPDRSMLLMSVRSRALRWIFRTFFGEEATHVGIYLGGKVYHITYTKALRISQLENVLAANVLLAVSPLPPHVTERTVADAAEALRGRAYNRPLFWYMFLRQFCRNWRLWTPELFRDPHKVMCADILSFTMDRALVSHAETPETVFNRYRNAGAAERRPAFAEGEVASSGS